MHARARRRSSGSRRTPPRWTSPSARTIPRSAISSRCCPLTITVEEFAGREKISYLSRKLRHRGSPGSDPERGDLIYFVPWGNLGFYYNAEGIGYSDDTIHLGTYDATLDELERLEGEVTVEIID